MERIWVLMGPYGQVRLKLKLYAKAGFEIRHINRLYEDSNSNSGISICGLDKNRSNFHACSEVLFQVGWHFEIQSNFFQTKHPPTCSIKKVNLMVADSFDLPVEYFFPHIMGFCLLTISSYMSLKISII